MESYESKLCASTDSGDANNLYMDNLVGALCNAGGPGVSQESNPGAFVVGALIGLLPRLAYAPCIGAGDQGGPLERGGLLLDGCSREKRSRTISWALSAEGAETLNLRSGGGLWWGHSHFLRGRNSLPKGYCTRRHRRRTTARAFVKPHFSRIVALASSKSCCVTRPLATQAWALNSVASASWPYGEISPRPADRKSARSDTVGKCTLRYAQICKTERLENAARASL